jgi:hypothetical protein
MKTNDLIVLRIEDQDLYNEFSKEIGNSSEISEIPVLGAIAAGEPLPSLTIYPEQIHAMIIALSSTGAFTALYQIVAKVMERNKDREISLEYAGAKIVIKGHSLPDERKFIQQFFLDSKKPRNAIINKKSSARSKSKIKRRNLNNK